MLWSVNAIGPSTGMSASTGIVSRGRSEIDPALLSPSPSTRARPVPRNVSARPDTTWSARNVMVMIACRRLSSPPASIAVTTPSHGFPVATAVENPTTAPMSIIPSTPRLSTPDRSARISPTAANSRIVPTAMPAAKISWRSTLAVSGHDGPGRHARHDPDPVAQEDLARDEAEQDDPLDHRGHAGRLDLPAGEHQGAEQDGDGHDAQGMELGQVRHDDRRVPVARREVVLEPVDDARDLRHAGQARQAARHPEHQQDEPRDRDAGVAGSARVVADQPDLVPQRAPLDDPPHHAGRPERD